MFRRTSMSARVVDPSTERARRVSCREIERTLDDDRARRAGESPGAAGDVLRFLESQHRKIERRDPPGGIGEELIAVCGGPGDGAGGVAGVFVDREVRVVGEAAEMRSVP